MTNTRIARNALLPIAAGAVVLAACGSGSSSGSAQSTPAGAGASTLTVTNGVLFAPGDHALYVSDQEMSGTIKCTTDACTAIWLPFTVAGGQAPTGPSQLAGELGTVKRPDGKSQVTLNGAPLYMFSFDHTAGAVGGDGQKDSFDGVNFSWHAARASGATAPASTTPAAPQNGGGYGY